MIHQNKKHIVIVTSEFPPQPGGIGNHAHNLALFLSKKGYNIKVISDQRAKDNSQEILFDKSLPFQVARIKLRTWRLLMYVHRIILTLKSINKADYVIATGKFSLWSVAFCTQFLKCSSMAVIHGSEVNFKSIGLRSAINMALKQFNSIVAVSNYTKELVSHIKQDVVVIPNGIDFEKWKLPNKPVIQLEGNPVLTTVGRVSVRKGQLQVIELLPEVIKSYPELHYHCIGMATEAEDFFNRAKEIGVDTHVTFHGVVEDEHLKFMLNATDVFVMLSTENQNGDVEGFGIAILEANALGVPAIGSKGCGIEDAIEEGVTGFLIDSQSSVDFKNSIEDIMVNKNGFNMNTIKWAQSHDWNMIVKQYIGLIS